jgi:hypothetical protein
VPHFASTTHNTHVSLDKSAVDVMCWFTAAYLYLCLLLRGNEDRKGDGCSSASAALEET